MVETIKLAQIIKKLINRLSYNTSELCAAPIVFVSLLMDADDNVSYVHRVKMLCATH